MKTLKNTFTSLRRELHTGILVISYFGRRGYIPSQTAPVDWLKGKLLRKDAVIAFLFKN